MPIKEVNKTKLCCGESALLDGFVIAQVPVHRTLESIQRIEYMLASGAFTSSYKAKAITLCLYSVNTLKRMKYTTMYNGC